MRGIALYSVCPKLRQLVAFNLKSNLLFADKNLALDPSLVDEMDAVEINDGSGRVLANLDVFYNLHCLNFARKYIFRSEYPLQFPGNGHQVQRGYLTHCIDSIRQSLVCHADIALHTYTWEDFQLVPYPDFKVDHECKNWDSIVNWTKKYAAPSLGGSVLKHPVYGKSCPAPSIARNAADFLIGPSFPDL